MNAEPTAARTRSFFLFLSLLFFFFFSLHAPGDRRRAIDRESLRIAAVGAFSMRSAAADGAGNSREKLFSPFLSFLFLFLSPPYDNGCCLRYCLSKAAPSRTTPARSRRARSRFEKRRNNRVPFSFPPPSLPFLLLFFSSPRHPVKGEET